MDKTASTDERRRLSNLVKAPAHEPIRRHHAVPTRRIAQLCTCLLHRKTTVGCKRNPCAIDSKRGSEQLTFSQSSNATAFDEKHESPLCTSARESVCIPSSRDPRRRDQANHRNICTDGLCKVSKRSGLSVESIGIFASSLTAASGPLDQRSSLLVILDEID